MPTTTSPTAALHGVPTPPRTSPGHILVVEDDPATAELVRLALEQHRRERVVIAPTGREALSWLEGHRPELIIIDLGLPDAHGSSIISYITDGLGIGDYIPMLVITGDTDASTRLAALRLGATDVIRKPIDVQDLTQRARNHLGVRATVDALANITHVLKSEVKELETLRSVHVEEQARLLRSIAAMHSAETADHMDRVGELAARLAQAAGRDDLATPLRTAASLHDIGKIGIPDAILLKPGSLDPHERAVLETHPTLGARLLSESAEPVMRLAAEVALTHHERWDGTGYPSGLTGNQIPLSGRITAVADVYDALISHRSYKMAWPPSAAVGALRHLRGSYLDPSLVDLFLGTCVDNPGACPGSDRPDLP